jgi:hypothetical protein
VHQDISRYTGQTPPTARTADFARIHSSQNFVDNISKVSIGAFAHEFFTSFPGPCVFVSHVRSLSIKPCFGIREFLEALVGLAKRPTFSEIDNFCHGFFKWHRAFCTTAVRSQSFRSLQ